MKKWKIYLHMLTFFMLFSFLLLALPMVQNGLSAVKPTSNSDKTSSSEGSASQEELAQILAPIALYPDTLLAQMFMAATYPLEIVEAARFIKKEHSLKDDALDKALIEKEWDVSVKSLCHFPTVLASLSENLDATKRLGEYFLDDQKAVMDMVQALRAKARKEGNLKTTKEQNVVEEDNVIIIEPANPQVIYVPSYSSTYVYGSWWYPHYPPYAWYPPYPNYGFGVGIAVGIGVGHWCTPHWGRGDIDIDINRTANFNKVSNRGNNGNRQSWKHDPSHRQGVVYSNKGTREKFDQSNRTAKVKSLDRGYGAQGLDKKTRDSINKQGLKSNADQLSGNRSNKQSSSAFKSSGSSRQPSRMSQRGSTSRGFSGGGGRGGGGRGGGGGGGGRR